MSKLYRPTKSKVPNGKVKFLTISGIVIAIIGLIISIVPFFGSVSVAIGLVGFVFNIFAFRLRSKHALGKRLPIIGLVLSVLAFSLGSTNYLKHKNAVDLILGVPGAKSKLLLVPEDSPLREVVESGSGYTEEEISKRKQESSKKKLAKSREEPEPDVDEAQYGDATKKIHDKKTSAPLESYYYSVVDQLRIRSKPEIGSEVLGHLEFGEQVIWYGEKSEKMEKIILAGKERNAHWYKVEPIRGFHVTGWVYGGALLNATSPSSDRLLDRTVKTYNFISSDSLQVLLGRSVYGEFNYSGLMTCYLGELNNLISHGQFYFYGTSAYHVGELSGNTEEKIKGVMKDGKLHGDFVSKVGLLESYIDLKIKFEEGTCISYEMVNNEEGDLSKSKSNDPEDCSYDEIYRKLKYIN